MRDIRFRGYSQKYEQWLFGSLDKDANGEPVIRYWVKDADGCHSNHAIKVIPETVGQFTGLLDKNGKEIYEGDEIMVGKEHAGHIFLDDGCFQITGNENTGRSPIGKDRARHFVVCGNIHEGGGKE